MTLPDPTHILMYLPGRIALQRPENALHHSRPLPGREPIFLQKLVDRFGGQLIATMVLKPQPGHSHLNSDIGIPRVDQRQLLEILEAILRTHRPHFKIGLRDQQLLV